MDAEQLKAWRKEREYTQDEAADILGIKKRQYQNLELAVSPINKTIEKLISLLPARRR